jgi:tetratricopeptide (TPR) repeat protein
METIPANPLTSAPRTFDDVRDANLDQVYQQGREEVLRDQVFSILLARADTVEKLEQLVFANPAGLTRWTRKELIEISNRFRLLSSPENEIRLYRECQDEAYRRAPRVREFYVLALNKLGRPADAIHEASRIIAEGGQNGLLWGTLGEAYSARMRCAEQLAQGLVAANGDLAALDPHFLADLAAYFPHIDQSDMSVARARALREENLRAAIRMFQHGFRESGSSFTGLGWLLRTIDHLADLVVTRGNLEDEQARGRLDGEAMLRLKLVDAEIQTLDKGLDNQLLLVDIALTLQGGLESLDYWTNAGILLSRVFQGAELTTLHTVIARLFATVDADFKLATTLAELKRVRDQFATMRQVEEAHGRATAVLAARLHCVEFAIAECEAGRARFQRTGQATRSQLVEDAAPGQSSGPTPALTLWLEKTFNFQTLTGSLIPIFISGSIGRVGARVPDLLINRQVQEDLTDLIETNVLQPLTAAERNDPRAVIARIQQVVGAGLKVGDLQDLQSPAHAAFDIRSDGLIALAGVDELRRYSRTTTDLTATLLLQNGDCRETMYLNGALFACWQQLEVKKRIAKAMLCLELDYQEGFETILAEEIPPFLRYQLRGGQVGVYVDSIAMRGKYDSERVSAADPTAVLRPYGLDELRSGQPLTRYELENSVLKLTYRNGTVAWLEPRDPATGRWRPIPHTSTPDGGVPLLDTVDHHLDGAPGEQISQIHLLNLVEEHALTFLYDTQQQTVEFLDGFYNETLFDSPYTFGSGVVNVEEILTYPHLIRAGSRAVQHPDGSRHPHPVYLQFLPFSLTEYESALMEGDIPGTIRLMGRTFSGDLKRERRRLDGGASPIPALLEKVHHWQSNRRQNALPDRRQVELRLARLMLDLARQHPDLVQLEEVTRAAPLIIEGSEQQHVYLVLSGRLQVLRQQQPLRDQAGRPVIVGAGGLLGELALLRDGLASATVAGDAVVLSIAATVLKEQLANSVEFRQVLEAMAAYRIL